MCTKTRILTNGKEYKVQLKKGNKWMEEDKVLVYFPLIAYGGQVIAPTYPTKKGAMRHIRKAYGESASIETAPEKWEVC